MTMLRRDGLVRFCSGALCLLFLFAVGCAGKKDVATISAPSGSSGEAPGELDLVLEAEVPETAAVRSIDFSGDGPKRPGDPVTFTANAVVPEGGSLRVQVMETDWTVSTAAGGSDRYSLSSNVPADLPAGRYPVVATIVDSAGSELAALRASRDLQVEISMSCAELQKALGGLTVYFAFDKYSLDSAAKANLARIGEAMRDAGDGVTLNIEGHCDERGTVEYNLALSEERARAARDYLVSLGAVTEDRTRLFAYGEESPADPGHNEAAWARNRRAEFKAVCSGN